MANDTDEIRVGTTGSVHVAPKGTALPAEPDEALNAAFIELGYTTEDGLGLSPSMTFNRIPGWQSSKPLRITKTEDGLSVSATLKQLNRTTLPLAFGGGTVTETVGENYKFAPPAAGTVDERAFVFQWVDGSYTYVLVVPRGMVAETSEIVVNKTDSIDLPITVEVLGSTPDDWFLLTDDPAFAEAA